MKLRIVTEKKGWILYRKAEEIARRHPGTRINRRWPRADIHYFINYGYYKPVKQGITVANFTHYDPDHLGDVFLRVANEVDHCTAVSKATRQKMISLGIPAGKITTILVGADEVYRPKVSLGLVGRTYPGGRKGEHLVAKLLEDTEVMEGLEIVADRPGWGVPVLEVESLERFYRSIDFLLVPSLIEGGPVPFMEALACGVKSIAPPIGVIPEFPHIEYETGNYQSLRDVILTQKKKVLEERENLSGTIRSYNWQRWAEEHLALFRRLLGESGAESA